MDGLSGLQANNSASQVFSNGASLFLGSLESLHTVAGTGTASVVNPASVVHVWDCRGRELHGRSQWEGNARVETLAPPDISTLEAAEVTFRSLPVNWFRTHRKWPGKSVKGSSEKTFVILD